MTDSDFHTPAAAVNRLFAALDADAATAAAPLVERLFAAQGDGHAYIRLTSDECDRCRQAAPFIGRSGSGAPLLLHGDQLFTANTFALEQRLAQEIRRLSYEHPLNEAESTAELLHTWFAGESARDQQAAAALTLLQNFVLISGGPGTGKTTTVAKLLALLCRDGLPRIALAAPTGKAAARMSEALHRAVGSIGGLSEAVVRHLLSLQGQTIHRLLGLQPPAMRPQFDAQSPLALDILLLDEASMVDSYLLYQLLCALPDGCRVVLLGDADQLPSVGAGAVVSALSRSPSLSLPLLQTLHRLLPDNPLDQVAERHARLRISHRFGADSGIGNLARAVAEGQSEQAAAAFAAFPEQLQQHDSAAAAALLFNKQQAYWQAVDSGDVQAAFTHQNDAVILTALREDAAACNLACRRLLKTRCSCDTDAPWFAGQMLLITRNDAAQKLYNGDTGLVLPDEHGRLSACFAAADGVRRIALSALPEHDDAFALTVHKSQGSEYGEVLFAAPAEGYIPGRALLYTAVTRAKHRFAYIGSISSLKAACQNPEQRRTALAKWLNTPTADHPDFSSC